MEAVLILVNLILMVVGFVLCLLALYLVFFLKSWYYLWDSEGSLRFVYWELFDDDEGFEEEMAEKEMEDGENDDTEIDTSDNDF